MATDTKTEYNSIFGGASADKVGTIGTINDGTYNVPWIIYTISGNTYQLFPMKSLAYHVMNSNGSNDGGYTKSDMYKFVHNTILPNLKKSGLNITDCDLVSQSVYNDIVSKTGKTSKEIAGYEIFWLTDPYSFHSFCNVGSSGRISSDDANWDYGVRPLITIG